jgi:exopolysaccharide biosynthesis predicted pyruvyltransferase EpsI
MSDIPVASKISQIFKILENQNQDALTQEVDQLLANVYGLILLFLGDELTPQERQAWLYTTRVYPKPCTGVEIARSIGSSETSKTIYKSIENLKQKRLVIINQLHPRVFSIQANKDHPLTHLLIDFNEYYGEKT